MRRKKKGREEKRKGLESKEKGKIENKWEKQRKRKERIGVKTWK